MSELSEADSFLLDRIRLGESEGWSQLVERYQGRLLAFARAQLRQKADAEDLVQETFTGFLMGLASYRAESSLETWLFTILRRRLVDHHRRQRPGEPPAGATDQLLHGVAAREPSASWYASQDEAVQHHRGALAAALRAFVHDLQKGPDFRDLKAAELLFYIQERNKHIAESLGLRETHIALLKHRWVKQIKALLSEATGGPSDGGLDPSVWESPDRLDGLLGEVWRELRLSCPKRSTLGRHLLRTLEEDWTDYVQFHLDALGCPYCKASIEDLREETAGQDRKRVKDRILESTIGFFRK